MSSGLLKLWMCLSMIDIQPQTERGGSTRDVGGTNQQACSLGEIKREKEGKPSFFFFFFKEPQSLSLPLDTGLQLLRVSLQAAAPDTGDPAVSFSHLALLNRPQAPRHAESLVFFYL